MNREASDFRPGSRHIGYTVVCFVAVPVYDTEVCLLKKLILYGSKHGCTEKCAYLLRDQLGKVDTVDLCQSPSVDLESYDTILIGSSVYAGQINKAVARFCTANLTILQKKQIGLFICCGLPDKAIEQLETGFPKKLVQIARAKGYFGYQLDMARLSFFERMLVRVLGKRQNERDIRHAAIKDFAQIFMQAS
jgi:menaquinone-dependent protoporphyrinogen oxidase